MSTLHLDKLLDPQSIALIGASDRPGSPGLLLAENLVAGAYKGTLYFINPRYETVVGQKCYTSVKKLPEAPELAILISPERTLKPTLEHCANLGVKVAVVMSATKKPELLHQFAEKIGIRLLGPFSAGIIRPPMQLNATYTANKIHAGPVALVTQSASLAAAILDWAQSSGVGFSALLSSGSDTDVSLSDVLDLLAEDHHTKAIIVYVDRISNARSFMSAISAASRIKPVVLMKSTQDSARYCDALTRTGQIFSADQVFQSAMGRAGVVRIRTFSNLFEAAKILTSGARTKGHRLAIVSNGAAPAMLACERLMNKQFALPALSTELHKRIVKSLNVLDKNIQTRNSTVERRGDWSNVNPIVLRNSQQLDAQYSSVTSLIQESGEYDAVLVIFVADPRSDAKDIASSLVPINNSAIPLLTCWMGEQSVQPARQLFAEKHIATFRTPEAAIDGFDFLHRHYRSQQQLLQLPNPASRHTRADVGAASELVWQELASGSRILGPVKTRSLLKLLEIEVMPATRATSLASALQAANDIGYPVAVKIVSPNLMYKSSVAQTQLNIQNDEQLSKAFEYAQSQLKQSRPGAQNRGVLVEAMYQEENHRELSVRVHQDPNFGPVISLGIGGEFSVVDMPQHAQLPPLNQFLIDELLSNNDIRSYLGSYRHKEAVDSKSLSQVLRRVSELVTEIPEIHSLDINPLAVSNHNAIALSAQIVVEQRKDRKAYQHLAIHPYPWKWIQNVTLKNDLSVTLRPIRPSDAQSIRTLVQNMSAESRYFRFLHTIKDLTPLMVAQFTKLDYDRQIAFVAERVTDSDEDSEIIGVSRYTKTSNDNAGEFAVSVADHWQGHGVASTLMNLLIAHAMEQNLKSLFGDVLRTNVAMQKLMQSMNFIASNHPEETELLMYSINLEDSN